MPKIEHTKRAQQRYETQPVLDPTTGEPRYTVMMRNGKPLLTKRGAERRMPVTQRDLTKPLPMPVCDSCQQTIEVGTAYKSITPHGGRTRTRHESCPTWHVWEYSSSLSARLAQIQYNGSKKIDAASLEDLGSVRDGIAEEIRALGEEKAESASNIEDGFGHETYQSAELQEQADNLESWADEIEQAETPDEGEQECSNCDGTGEEKSDCTACVGTGTGAIEDDGSVTEEECASCEGTGEVSTSCTECDGTGTQELDEEALEEAKQSLRDALDNCPL